MAGLRDTSFPDILIVPNATSFEELCTPAITFYSATRSSFANFSFDRSDLESDDPRWRREITIESVLSPILDVTLVKRAGTYCSANFDRVRAELTLPFASQLAREPSNFGTRFRLSSP